MVKRILISLIPFLMINLWLLIVTSRAFLSGDRKLRYGLLYLLFRNETYRQRRDSADEAAEQFASRIGPALFVIFNIIAAGFAVFAFTHP